MSQPVLQFLFWWAVIFGAFSGLVLWIHYCREPMLGKPTYCMGEHYTESGPHAVWAALMVCIIVALSAGDALFFPDVPQDLNVER
jgi:hypothetical protein